MALFPFVYGNGRKNFIKEIILFLQPLAEDLPGELFISNGPTILNSTTIMAYTTNEIKKGLTIDYNNDLYTVVDFQHVKPGKGGAFVRTKLKSATTGKTIDVTFNSGATINPVRIERRKCQFLYKDDSGYNFMDQTTFDQIAIEEDLVDGAEFLKEGQEVEIAFHAETEKPLSVDLPPFVILEITYSEPGVKGDTANNPMKAATLETGAIVQVPLFVDSGIRIKVDTRTKTYVERVKD
jgi:elongation factor P